MTTHENLGFSQALDLVKDGHKIWRSGWNGKNMWVALWRPEDEDDEYPPAMTVPFLYMYTAQGDKVPWTISQMDVLACDWSARPFN